MASLFFRHISADEGSRIRWRWHTFRCTLRLCLRCSRRSNGISEALNVPHFNVEQQLTVLYVRFVGGGRYEVGNYFATTNSVTLSSFNRTVQRCSSVEVACIGHRRQSRALANNCLGMKPMILALLITPSSSLLSPHSFDIRLKISAQLLKDAVREQAHKLAI
jgi:hypothetical protein